MPQELRKIEIRYKPEQIGQDVIDRVCRYYKNNSQFQDILQVINGPRSSGSTINLVDIYAIINVAAQNKKLKQRTRFTGTELRINDFVTVYRAWQKGMKPKEILALFPNCKIAIERVLRAINLRHKEERAKLELVSDAAAREVLGHAVPMNLQGQRGWWIPADAIQTELIVATGLNMPGLEEDILIDERKTIEDCLPKPEVSSGNKPEPHVLGEDPGRHFSRPYETDEAPLRQTEDEILASDVYEIPEEPESDDAEEAQAQPRAIKDALDDIL